jgi:hypothetical protein
MVAKTGLDMGTTILEKILSCVAPSILADSIMESGIVDLKNVLQITTLKEETKSGRISAQIESLKPKRFVLIT